MRPVVADDRARLRHAVINQVGIVTGNLQLLSIEDLAEDDRDSISEIMAAARAISVLVNEYVDTGGV